MCDDGGRPETRGGGRGVSGRPLLPLSATAPPWAASATGTAACSARAAAGSMILHEDDTLYPWYLDTVVPRLRAGLSAVCTRRRAGRGAAGPAALHRPRPRPGPIPRCISSRARSRRFPACCFRASSDCASAASTRAGVRWPTTNSGTGSPAAGPVEVVRAIGAFYRVSPGQWTESQWPVMLRQMHLLRLRIAREQLPGRPRLGRWLARFFTHRNARAYARRFPRPARRTGPRPRVSAAFPGPAAQRLGLAVRQVARLSTPVARTVARRRAAPGAHFRKLFTTATSTLRSSSES